MIRFVTRARWLWLLLCFIAFPFTARADGIDLSILITYGLGIFLPLLLFNATVEAPIMGRFLGIKSSELWPSWFKANIWSLLAGIPALVLNEALTGWFLPAELQPDDHRHTWSDEDNFWNWFERVAV